MDDAELVNKPLEAWTKWALVWLTVFPFVGILVSIRFHNREFLGGMPLFTFGRHSTKAANVRGAVETADLVLLAVPYGAVKEVLTEIRPLLRGKTLIDATNALSADFSSLTLGFTTSAAEEIAKLVPDAHVVKAFNTVFAQVYAS